jgi:hypothetical protein
VTVNACRPAAGGSWVGWAAGRRWASPAHAGGPTSTVFHTGVGSTRFRSLCWGQIPAPADTKTEGRPPPSIALSMPLAGLAGLRRPLGRSWEALGVEIGPPRPGHAPGIPSRSRMSKLAKEKTRLGMGGSGRADTIQGLGQGMWRRKRRRHRAAKRPGFVGGHFV